MFGASFYDAIDDAFNTAHYYLHILYILSKAVIYFYSLAQFLKYHSYFFFSIFHSFICIRAIIVMNVHAEYDAMHPQMQFHQEALQQQRHGHRWKRGVMPTVKFNAPDIERDGDFWNNAAQDILKKQLQKNTLNKNVAKNIILFLGDGMSIPTLAATRIYMGGEDRELSFEKFPYNGLSKVCEMRQSLSSFDYCIYL